MDSNRRNFLKHSALLGTMAAVSPFASVSGRESRKQTPPAAANKGNSYTVNMSHVRAVRPQPRQLVIPDVEGFKVLKGDYHIHTLFSDGQVMPNDRVDEAVQLGFDAIAITDHIEARPFFSKGGRWKLLPEQADNFNIWYEAAKSAADKQNIILVRAAEITKWIMPPGHFNALFTTDNNPIAAVVDDWRAMLQTAAEQGAFLLWNHPGWQEPRYGGIEKGAPLNFTGEHEEVCKKGWLHGIEVYNGAVDEYYPVVSDWCNEWDLAVFANSDNHPSEINHYGFQNPLRPVTLTLAKERTLESLREGMFARRTIAWAGGLLWGRDPWLPALFKASVEIKTVTPGTVELTNTSSLPVSVTMGNAVIDLPKDVKRQVCHNENVKTLTVTNWMIGMNKALEIRVE